MKAVRLAARPRGKSYFEIDGIYSNVFKDEIIKKLNVKSEALPFTLTMLSRSKMMISGVKSVLSSTEKAMKFRLAVGSLTVSGDALQIAEIGGGDVYVKGLVEGVQFE